MWRWTGGKERDEAESATMTSRTQGKKMEEFFFCSQAATDLEDTDSP